MEWLHKNPNFYCLLIGRTERCRNLLRHTLAVNVTYNFYYKSYHDANDDFVIPTASLLTAVTSLLNMTSLSAKKTFPGTTDLPRNLYCKTEFR